MENNSGWINTFALNGVFQSACLSLFFSSLWMIKVTTNLDLTFLLCAFSSFMASKYGFNVIALWLNDKSQYAKPFLIFAQFVGIVSGMLIVYAGKGYYAEKVAGDQKGLYDIQKSGLTLN